MSTQRTSRTGSLKLPVLPLRDVVLFPHVAMPLLIGRDASLAAVTAALDGSREILLVTQRNADVNVPTGTDLYRIGVRARVQQATRVSNGTTKILVDGLERVQVSRFTTTKALQATKGAKAGTLIEARVDPLPFKRARAGGPQGSETTHARIRHALSLFEDYSGLQRRLPPEVIGLLQGLDDEERIAFGIAAHLQIPIEQRQALLGAASLADLSTQLVNILGAELELLKLERKIDDQVRGSLFQNQREFFLQEQLRAIHRELGQEDGDEFEEMAKQIAARGLPEAVETRAHRELRRLKRSSPTSPDAAVSRGWLDWVLALPWTARTVDTTDLDVARTSLEGDHYGLAEVKERILDHIAVLARVGKLPGPILCLVGPPGVGKTSLGRSIAHALDRKFVRMALGGVRDEAEIRGHRRTYIGAMPGRILQAMRRAESVNPVILLDEIDKLGADFRGDPAAALLEVLDPEQNSAFNDHYLEVDYDLSQVLFVTTANSLGSIPEALRDRMEIIRLPGYLEQEKLAIARRFLVPKQLVANGVPADRVTLADDVLPAIIRNYTREAGVRDLERRIARLSRKLARRAWTDKNTHTVSTDDLHAMLGTAPHPEDELNLEDQVGVANGLAYTSTGGELLEIEVSVVPGRGRLQLTGTLGDVIKESAAAALSFVRARASALGLSPDFHRTRDIHVHLPAGATPKDGPSAGIALATALISALTGIPVRGDVAMTGEVTLRGRVLPIGGLREKGVAAHRHRIAHVIVPAANMKDLNELPDDVRAGVTWHVARTMDEVLAVALRGAVPTLREERIVLSDAPGMVT
ncbi:endopeptidase La [Gemmatimonas sp.]|uniref:endopeptidase La n=1 Tax=Gemmatimonas sp. TaxID=1962908 RepID=UPI0033422744